MNNRITVTEIQVKETIEELWRKEQRVRRCNNTIGPAARHDIIRRYWGGNCTRCGSLPSKRVSYDVGDNCQHASRIEYYCSKCFQESGIGTSKKVVKVLDTGQRNETVAIREKN